jgi:transglutaminase-like putative cysteine protease
MKSVHGANWVAAAVVALAPMLCAGRAAEAPAASRTFEFTYQVQFPAMPEASGPAELWIPEPVLHDAQQEVAADAGGARDAGVRITSAVAYESQVEPEYGNRFLVFHPTKEQVASGFDASMQFIATRREYAVLRDGRLVAASGPPADAKMLQRYAAPDKLVPIDGVIARLAAEQTAGATTTMEKARRIYGYVVKMRYDKSGEGWGRGDAVWACDTQRGNCTDFHSLFIGMMRAEGIPARFEIGFPLPEGQSAGAIPGYHCWAEFYLAGMGWIPVDASEASKNPAKKEYFFGALDVNRVQFTYGRDLRLSPEQKGAPLNYFIYPYAEVAGQPVKGLVSHFAFRDVARAEKGEAGGSSRPEPRVAH